MKKILTAFLTLFFSLNFLVISQENSSLSQASWAFVQGTEAYKKGDWVSSITLFKKALSFKENDNADTWYMLICAEMYASDYKNAYDDMEVFSSKFPENPYSAQILYQKGRALYNLGEYEKAILLLSDFCHQYPENSLYPSALFWIGESFYSSYNYDESRLIFERLVNDFPEDTKTPTAQFRLDSLNQRTREEKLLYLLKETGEEYLSAKEDYERQMRIYGSETSEEVRRRMADLQNKNADLELQNKNLTIEKNTLQKENDSLQDKVYESEKQQDNARKTELTDNQERINLLKRKAKTTQNLLDSRKNQEAK